MLDSHPLELKKLKHVHFIGIGGVSMSALAMMLKNQNISVSGSDFHVSPTTQYLSEQGVTVAFGHNPDNIPPETDLVVYTAAIAGDNPEYLAAQKRGIPEISRAKLLGRIMQEYAKSIAVSGTHGKTTVTSMLSHILLAADTDPTITVGAYLNKLAANYRIGNSEYFLLEACEYCNSFHNFFPAVSIILNISEDHLDFFKDLKAIQASFHQFGLNTKDVIILHSSLLAVPALTEGWTQKLISFDQGGDYHAENLRYQTDGTPEFDAFYRDRLLGHIQLSVFGRHNVSNALAAIAAADTLGIPFTAVQNGLAEFRGADRRFQKKGSFAGIDVYDDYAHHPEEIAATLQAAEKLPHKRLWLIFQPHTYSRTKLLFDDFVSVLQKPDFLILADIYAAREKNTYGIHSKDLANAVSVHNPNAYYLESFDEIENFVLEHAEPGDLLITMGAGDIYFVGEALLSF